MDVRRHSPLISVIKQIDQFLRLTLGEAATSRYRIIVDDGPLVAATMVKGVRKVRASQRLVHSLRGTRSALNEIRPSLFSEISKGSRGLSMLFVRGATTCGGWDDWRRGTCERSQWEYGFEQTGSGC